ncbi:hypothetical protein GCM10022278_03760 [Allohahella marinimesophila]|uniref:NolW-like domain-containing protein n=2 Tax=Allohahella marinimesophila TaxID=1054972 RepID=A0ABP7NIC1_9GAMM
MGLAKLATVRIYYHDASAIADRLNMMFEPADLKASGLGRDLILRASSEALLHDAKTLVADLDRQPAQFRIFIREVAQGSGRNGDLRTSVEGKVGAGTGSRDGRADISVSYGNRSYSTGSRTEQTVTVLEGSSVSLTAGQLRPVQNVYLSHSGIAVGNAGERELVGSDLLVTPTLAGPEGEPRARVTLAVRHQRDARDGQSLDAFELASTQLLPFGEWAPLGGSTSRSRNDSDGSFGTSYSTRSSDMTQHYEIMIHLLP